MKYVAAAITAALVCSCATPQTIAPTVSAEAAKSEALAQQRYVIEQRLAEGKRVDRIHSALSVSNLEFCKIKSRSIGAEIYSLQQYGKSFKPAAQAIGLTNAPTIAYTLEGSPAEASGLKAGDQILELDGKAIPQTNRGARQIDKKIAGLKDSKPVSLKVKRAEEMIMISVQPRELCGYPIAVIDADEMNAFADGGSIFLNRRMLSATENDEQLALIIGHELAHNAMGHIDAMQTNQVIGMVGGAMFDILIAATTGYAGSSFTRAGGEIGAGAYSKEFESEADYAGLYFIARAGFKLDGVENVWRKFALEYPSGISFGGDHPTTPERYLAIAMARDEIIAAQASGSPLRPKMKSGAAAEKAASPAVANGIEGEAASPPLTNRADPAALTSASAN